jgi:hypothetical protein
LESATTWFYRAAQAALVAGNTAASGGAALGPSIAPTPGTAGEAAPWQQFHLDLHVVSCCSCTSGRGLTSQHARPIRQTAGCATGNAICHGRGKVL